MQFFLYLAFIALLLWSALPTMSSAQNGSEIPPFDANWSEYWTGNTQDFVFHTDFQQLQLNAQQPGQSVLLHPIAALPDSALLSIDLAFAPSNANRFEWICFADQDPSTTTSWNGISVRMGENGSEDRPRLMLVAQGSYQELGYWEAVIGQGGSVELSYSLNRVEHSITLYVNGQSKKIALTENAPFLDLSQGYSGFAIQYTRSNQQNTTINRLQAHFSAPQLVSISADLHGFSAHFSHPIKQLEAALLEGETPLAYDIQARVLKAQWPSALAPDKYAIQLSNLAFFTGSQSYEYRFSVEKAYRPQFQEVQITELLYRATDTYAEFIELFNASDSPIPLHYFTIEDPRNRYRLPSGAILQPQQYVLLSPDTKAWEGQLPPDLLIESPLPTLNNGGDRLWLKLVGGEVIDSVQYQAGSSTALTIERRSLSTSGWFTENWEDADLTQEESPAQANTVQLDFEAPALLSYEQPASDSLYLAFDEKIQVDNLQLKKDGMLWDVKGDQYHQVAPNNLRLALPFELPPNQQSEIEILGIQDIFGNNGSYRISLFNLQSQAPQFGDLVITEYLADPLGGDGEFIEIYHQGPKEAIYDLRKLLLIDGQGNKVWLADPRDAPVLMTYESFKVIGNSGLEAGENRLIRSSFPALNNRNEQLQLWYEEQVLVEEIAWSELPPSPQPSATSMERTDPRTHGKDPSKWRRHPTSHSAGWHNHHFEQDQTPPKLIEARIEEQRLHLQFDEFTQPAEGLSELWLDGLYTPLSHAKASDWDTLKAYWAFELDQIPQSRVKTVTLPAWQDATGNQLPATDQPITHSPQAGELVLNEVLFDPLQDPNDGLPNQYQWVEVLNTSDFQLSLNGLFLHQGAQESGYHNRIDLPLQKVGVLPPNELALILSQRDSSLNLPPSTLSIPLDRSSLSLSKESGILYLNHTKEGNIDQIAYSVDWHHAHLFPKSGYSLERIIAKKSGHEPSNWSTSADKNGHTAGRPNATAVPVEQQSMESEKEWVHITPKNFSPNGDGFRDVCVFELRGHPPGSLIEARIFDRTGLQVRQLAANEPLQFTHQLIWNGRDDRHQRLRPGVYIVWLHWYDNQKSHKKVKKTLILAPS